MTVHDLLILRLYPETHVWLESFRNSLTEPMRPFILRGYGIDGGA
jgi:hypothetical protein